MARDVVQILEYWRRDNDTEYEWPRESEREIATDKREIAP